MTYKTKPRWKRSFPVLEPDSNPSGERRSVRASLLLLDADTDQAKLLEKVWQLRGFHVTTAGGVYALNGRPSADAVWLRAEADPTSQLSALRERRFQGPILVAAPENTKIDSSDQVVRVPFSAHVDAFEATLVKVLGIPARKAPDPLGLGMDEGVFTLVFNPAERHILRALIRARKEGNMTSVDDLEAAAEVTSIHSIMSRLRAKSWLFGIRIATISGHYLLLP
jgi:hypothetical protein